MKTIAYVARIKEIETENIWTEEFSDQVVDSMTPMDHCLFLIKRFNDNLQQGELPRAVISTRNSNKEVFRKHDWKKKSLATEKGGYDKYTCSLCGATGKRYGLAAFVTPDRSFTVYCKKV